jgi:hypothetical protein
MSNFGGVSNVYNANVQGFVGVRSRRQRQIASAPGGVDARRQLAPQIFGLMVEVNGLRTGIELLTDVGVEQNIVHNEKGLEDEFFNTAWIVASDHAMFRGHLQDRKTTLVFPAGNARKLAARIEELVSDRLLYRELSQASEAAWEAFRFRSRGAVLLQHWVRGEASDVEWHRNLREPR